MRVRILPGAPFSPCVRPGNLDRKYGGAGLGLPLAKALVEVQGGSMDLQSKVGVGTTVTVRLPFLRVKKALRDVESPDMENRRAS